MKNLTRKSLKLNLKKLTRLIKTLFISKKGLRFRKNKMFYQAMTSMKTLHFKYKTIQYLRIISIKLSLIDSQTKMIMEDIQQFKNLISGGQMHVLIAFIKGIMIL